MIPALLAAGTLTAATSTASPSPCSLAVFSRGEPFAERIATELASVVPCARVEEGWRPDARPWAVRVVSRSTVEVWERGALVAMVPTTTEDDVDAVKVAEHVRARILARAPDVDDAATDTKPADLTTSGTRRFDLSAGVGPVLDAGRLGLAARISMRVQLLGVLGAGGLVVAPLVPVRVSAAAGDAEVATFTGGAFVDAAFTSPRSPWGASVGLAGLVASTRATGVTRAPFEGRSVSGARILPAIVGGGSYALGGRAVLEASLAVGASPSPLPVRFAGQEVARVGSPYGLATLGARVEF